MILAESFYLSIDPILPFKLSNDFGFNHHQVGMFFFHFTVVVIVVIVPMLFIPHSTNKVLFILIGNFLLSVGSILTGPSKLFRLPNKVSTMIDGMILSGIGKGLVYSFIEAEIIKCGEARYPEQQNEVSKKIGVMLGIGYSISVSILPLTMSALYRAFNFETAMDVLGLVLFVNSIAYLLHISCSRKINDDTQLNIEEDEDETLLVKKDQSVIEKTESL